MERQWKDSVREAIKRICDHMESSLFTRKQLKLELPQMVEETGTQGLTPEKTMDRTLQQLRDLGEIEFLEPGHYQNRSITKIEISNSVDKIVDQIQEVAHEVYGILGPWNDEWVYQRALAVEFREREIDFQQQQSVDVLYKGHWVGRRVIDFVVEGCVAVELKNTETSVKRGNQLQAVRQGDLVRMTSMLINFRNTVSENPMDHLSRPGDNLEILVKASDTP